MAVNFPPFVFRIPFVLSLSKDEPHAHRKKATWRAALRPFDGLRLRVNG